MIRPADCPHHRATFLCRRPDGKKAYSCPDCGLVAVGSEYRRALERFRRKAEEERARGALASPDHSSLTSLG